MRRILLVMSVATLMAVMLVASAAPAFATHAPGDFFTASSIVLADRDEARFNAEPGLSTAFLHNRNP